jgi:hypothetical protein
MSNSNKKIKVVVAANVKRESVMIDPRGGAVIAEGRSKAELAKKLYGRR